MTTNNKDEKILGTIVAIVATAIVALFFIFGLIVKPEGVGGSSTEFLWDALHPFSAWDFIGIVLFLACAVFISGIWKKFLPNNPTMGPGINYLFFGIGVVGIILIFMS